MKITYRLHEVLFDIYHKIEDPHGPVHELSEPFRNLNMHIGHMVVQKRGRDLNGIS